MEIHQPECCTFNAQDSLKEEECLEPQTSYPLITFAVVVLISASVILSLVSGRYISPEQTENSEVSLLKNVPQSQIVLPPESEVKTPEKVTDDAQIEALGNKLFEMLDQAWIIPVRQTSIYVVQVNQNGEIISYTPINKIAQNNFKNTPLPDLIQSDDSVNSEKPLVNFAEFDVIFSSTGTLEVQPHNSQ